ncbi:MAG: hypothetical protein ACREVA_10305, partial [Burkholderiales bacterium]
MPKRKPEKGEEDGLSGLLSKLSSIRYQPTAMSSGLLGLGINLLKNSGPSFTPTSFGQQLGQGLEGFSEGVQGWQTGQEESGNPIDVELARQTRIAELDRLRNPGKYITPYSQVIYGPDGTAYAFDTRTTKAIPILDPSGVAIQGAKFTPELAGQIAAAKEYERGVQVTDEENRSYYAPLGSVNPAFGGARQAPVAPQAESQQESYGDQEIMDELEREFDRITDPETRKIIAAQREQVLNGPLLGDRVAPPGAKPIIGGRPPVEIGFSNAQGISRPSAPVRSMSLAEQENEKKKAEVVAAKEKGALETEELRIRAEQKPIAESTGEAIAGFDEKMLSLEGGETTIGEAIDSLGPIFDPILEKSMGKGKSKPIGFQIDK